MATVLDVANDCGGVEMSTEDLLMYLDLGDLLRVLEANMMNQFLKATTSLRRRQVRDSVTQQVEAIYTAVMGLDASGKVVGCDPGCPVGGTCRQCLPG